MIVRPRGPAHTSCVTFRLGSTSSISSWLSHQWASLICVVAGKTILSLPMLRSACLPSCEVRQCAGIRGGLAA